MRSTGLHARSAAFPARSESGWQPTNGSFLSPPIGFHHLVLLSVPARMARTARGGLVLGSGSLRLPRPLHAALSPPEAKHLVAELFEALERPKFGTRAIRQQRRVCVAIVGQRRRGALMRQTRPAHPDTVSHLQPFPKTVARGGIGNPPVVIRGLGSLCGWYGRTRGRDGHVWCTVRSDTRHAYAVYVSLLP